jgi:hypothetical protein
MELLTDKNFKNGFYLENPDAGTHDRNVDKNLCFGSTKEAPCWYMAQWWTPFNFKKAPIKKDGAVYSIQNESRFYSLDTSNGDFVMGLDSNLEYETLYHGVRKSSSTPWSHFLIEQDFKAPQLVTKLTSLIAHVEFSIDELKLFHKEEFDPSIHAAQLLWYLTINEKGSTYSPIGKNFIWFGLPLFDSRCDHQDFSAFLDVGNPGSTNRLIYNLDSRLYLPNKIEIGQQQIVNIDVLPLINKAIDYAIQNGIFASKDNLYVNYMNFGWELPGSYKVRSTIKGLSLEAKVR